MSFLNNLRIGPRLGLAFSAVIALAVLVGAIGLNRLAEVTASLSLIAGDRVPKVTKVVSIADDLNLIARELRNALIWNDATRIAAALNTAQKARENIDKTLAVLAPTIQSEEGKKRLAALVDARAAFLPAEQGFVNLVRAGKRADAEALLSDKLRPTQLAYMAALDSLQDLQIELINNAALEGEARYAAARWLMGCLLLGMALVGALLAALITRSITRPIGEAVALAEKVAEGDLSIDIDIRSSDETGQLMAALKSMNQRLTRIVSTVRSTSDSIATGSAQIASGNADLSQRTEEQASALQETAASMEELGSTVKLNADNARQANQLALGASAVATKGGNVVGQVVDTMKGINDSSKRIADIISVIDGIAFQTNILALNAAVEAARAGEQGRGFAVVASEVRNLAQRSAEAAKEIKGLITTSVERVEQGTALVDQAGVTMEEIVTSIKRVTDIMGEISSASSEQSTGVSQIGEAVNQMDQVTQQNAALVEESAAAAESLMNQAQQLVSAVSVFTLGHQPDSGLALFPADATMSTQPVDRRGPHRAANVMRPAFAKAKPGVGAHGTQPTAVAVRNGTDEWVDF